MRNILVAVVVAVALVGCGANLEKAVVGKFGFEIDTTSASAEDKAAAEMAKAFMGSMTMELKDDKTAVVSVLGQEQKGTWKLEGDKITITNQGQPMTGTVLDGGKKIEVTEAAGQASGKGVKMFLVKQ